MGVDIPDGGRGVDEEDEDEEFEDDEDEDLMPPAGKLKEEESDFSRRKSSREQLTCLSEKTLFHNPEWRINNLQVVD